ncbi:MAG: DUF881 domain-containing protein [Candidatus Nanopelagicales bacterium]|nr:DUF881 domain-containing protein [Candidatus Nanopelagicales bacterium]MCU0294472.1 DUF881 domain-containing protein [Candidatus Nanopelagicales bacterium]MCU0296901.1 DUF881 domain-containing protein [Candidatus Nanopelagicales bacterium]
MSRPLGDNLLDRLIAEAQADDYALALEQPGPTSTRQGRRVAGVVLFAVIGLLLAVSFVQTQTVQPAAAQRREALVSRIEAATIAAQEAGATATSLRLTVSELQILATRGLGEQFGDELRALEVASGFVGLEGPGAVLVMQDGTAPLPKGVSADEARVLDIDMQAGVNGLWEAGAQAIAINDIRLTSLTAIRTAGEAILVDFRPLEPPYRVVAIGPKDLAKRFARTQASDDLDQLRRDYGIQSEVAAADVVAVPASTANLPTKAEVVKGGGR